MAKWRVRRKPNASPWSGLAGRCWRGTWRPIIQSVRRWRLAVVQGLPVACQQVHQRTVQSLNVDIQRLIQPAGLFKRCSTNHLGPPIWSQTAAHHQWQRTTRSKNSVHQKRSLGQFQLVSICDGLEIDPVINPCRKPLSKHRIGRSCALNGQASQGGPSVHQGRGVARPRCMPPSSISNSPVVVRAPVTSQTMASATSSAVHAVCSGTAFSNCAWI